MYNKLQKMQDIQNTQETQEILTTNVADAARHRY